MKKIIIVILTIFGFLLFLLILHNIPFKYVVKTKNCEANDSSLKKIASLKHRDLYTYCLDDVKMIPNVLNNSTKPSTIRKGTIKTGFIWDGGTTIFTGVNYIIVDCRDISLTDDNNYLPLIITTSEYENNAWKYCHDKDYMRERIK